MIRAIASRFGHRQRAGMPQAHRAGVGVRLGAERVARTGRTSWCASRARRGTRARSPVRRRPSRLSLAGSGVRAVEASVCWPDARDPAGRTRAPRSCGRSSGRSTSSGAPPTSASRRSTRRCRRCWAPAVRFLFAGLGPVRVERPAHGRAHDPCAMAGRRHRRGAAPARRQRARGGVGEHGHPDEHRVADHRADPAVAGAVRPRDLAQRPARLAGDRGALRRVPRRRAADRHERGGPATPRWAACSSPSSRPCAGPRDRSTRAPRRCRGRRCSAAACSSWSAAG